jgi:ParB family transcriptional regulator, chromosome partitioning protein
MKSSQQQLATKAIGVRTVPTNALKPNPHNPRMLFDKEPLDVLKASIKKVGILVPLTVYRESKNGDYVILDGQRRWLCATELNLKTVPVNQVAEPTLVQNIVTMFQIHKLREDWELMPTALKLELLMQELRERNDERLAKLTGLPEAVVSRCKKLLSFPKRHQDMMLDPDPAKRVKSDFFIELYPIIHDRALAKAPWMKPAHFTDQMLTKYGPNKPIKAVTDFRLMKQHISNARNAGRDKDIQEKVKMFAEDKNALLETLHIETAGTAAAARRLTSDVRRLQEEIATLDVEKFYGEEFLWEALSDLLKLLQQKMKEADRRLI